MLDYNKEIETLVEIVHAYNYLYKENPAIEKVMDRMNYDSISMNVNFVKWANEFEEKNINADWNERDFISEIMQFTAVKLSKELDIIIMWVVKAK